MNNPAKTATHADKKSWSNRFHGSTSDLGKRLAGHPMSKTEIADYLVKRHQVEGSTAEELLDNSRYSKYAAKRSFDQLIEELNALRTLKQGINSILS